MFILGNIRDFFSLNPIIWKLLAYIDVYMIDHKKTKK